MDFELSIRKLHIVEFGKLECGGKIGRIKILARLTTGAAGA
jgi:hypothetical protein